MNDLRPDADTSPTGASSSAGTRVVAVLDPTRPGSVAGLVAAAVARRAGAVLEIVSVTTKGYDPPETGSFLDGERSRHEGVAVVATRLEAHSVVDSVLDHLGGGGIEVVVLPSHGRTPAAEALLGSISADLVRSSPAPTLLVGPNCGEPGPIERLVVAVDGSDDSLGALHIARDLSTTLGVEISLVEVAAPSDYSPDDRGAAPVGDVIEGAELRRIAGALDPPVLLWDVLHGADVAQSLADHAAEAPGTILVVGTHGRTPGRPRVLGGVAARVVRHASVPVLVVSPEAAARRGEGAGWAD